MGNSRVTALGEKRNFCNFCNFSKSKLLRRCGVYVVCTHAGYS